MFQITPCDWKCHEHPFNRFSAMLLRGMDSSEKSDKNSCVQGVKSNILKVFPIVPCIKSHLPWQFHENPYSRFSVMLLTDRHTNRQINEQRTTMKTLAEVKNISRKQQNQHPWIFWLLSCFVVGMFSVDKLVTGHKWYYFIFHQSNLKYIIVLNQYGIYSCTINKVYDLQLKAFIYVI